MNSVLAALIVGAFATTAAAQATDPKVTTEGAPSTSNTPQTLKDAAAYYLSPKAPSKMTTAEKDKVIKAFNKDPSKMTTAEKDKVIKDINKQIVGPERRNPGLKDGDRRFFLHVPEGAASNQPLR